MTCTVLGPGDETFEQRSEWNGRDLWGRSVPSIGDSKVLRRKVPSVCVCGIARRLLG